VGTELVCHVGLLAAAGDGDGPETHLGGELHAKVAQSTDSEDRDDVARTRTRLAQRVEHRHSRAGERGGLYRTELLRNPCQAGLMDDHLLGVTSGKCRAGDF
jgi:hypothetical protein